MGPWAAESPPGDCLSIPGSGTTFTSLPASAEAGANSEMFTFRFCCPGMMDGDNLSSFQTPASFKYAINASFLERPVLKAK
jgi:hypothetical protein